jgi:hypothetical protein
VTHPDLHTLTGAYALDALDDDERAAFEAHLPDCDRCRVEVDGFLATTALLGGAVAEAPPHDLRGAVLDAVARTRQDPPGTPGAARERGDRVVALDRRRRARRAWRERLLLPAAAVMAVVVAGLSIVVGNLNRRLDEVVAADRVASVVAAADLQTWDARMPDGGTVRVVYSATRGEGWFLADGMAATAADETYELWLIDDQGPSPAGLFQAADGRAAHAFTGDVEGVQAIGVTVEPASGSRQPTSDPIVVLEL